MALFIVRRILVGFVLFIALLTGSFFLVSLLPGSPSRALLGQWATPDQITQLNHKLGLDKPLPQRYADYMWNAFHGDLGSSFYSKQPVLHELLVRIPNTAVYLVPGLILALALGTLFGSLAAYRYRGPADKVVGLGSSVVLAVPEFVLGLVLIVVFFHLLRIAAAPIGMTSGSDAQPPTRTGSEVLDSILGGYWGTFDSILAHAVLPTATVAIFFAAPFARVVRSGMIQALNSDQIEFARACGLRPTQVLRYALVDVRTTVMTYFIIMLSSALSGAAIVESVFSWPGVGGWALQGVMQNDMPVIQGFVVVMGAVSIAGYIALDIATTLLDPRTRNYIKRSIPVPVAAEKLGIVPATSI